MRSNFHLAKSFYVAHHGGGGSVRGALTDPTKKGNGDTRRLLGTLGFFKNRDCILKIQDGIELNDNKTRKATNS